MCSRSKKTRRRRFVRWLTTNGNWTVDVLLRPITVGAPDLPEPWQWAPLTPPDSPEEP